MAETPRKGLLTGGTKVSTRPVHPGMARISLKQTFDKPPNTAESLIPVIGPAWEAGTEFEHGHPVMGAVDLGFAALDLVPGTKAAEWGVRAVTDSFNRGAKRGFEHALDRGWSHSAVRGRLRKAGVIKPGHQMHHGLIPSGRWGKNVPNVIKNSSWNIKSLAPVTHARVHGASKGLPKLNAVQRIWIGAPDSVKAGAGGLLGHIGAAIVGRDKEIKHGRR